MVNQRAAVLAASGHRDVDWGQRWCGRFVVSLVWKEAIDNFLRDVDENIFAGVDTGMSKILDERLGLFGRHGAGGGSDAATLDPE
jgi:hypothetical protein